MKRVIIMGSPRSNGRSAHIAEMLFEANIDERPEDELFLVPISEIEVGPCIGCGACRQLSEVTFKADDGSEYTEMRPRCVFDDDMQALYDILDDADELTVVSPIYFSGAPGLLKCLLDRLQPYFWADTRKAPKRPATLHVLGEGGDPHGYDALVSEVKSSLACAGFRLERVLDWVGRVDENGEILAEAIEVAVGTTSKEPVSPATPPATSDAEPQSADARPKLNLRNGKTQRVSGDKPANKAKPSRPTGRKEPSGQAKARNPKPRQKGQGGNASGGKAKRRG